MRLRPYNKNGKPGDIVPLASGKAVEQTAPKNYQRWTASPYKELPTQHAGFLCWALLPPDIRKMGMVAKVLERDEKTCRQWRRIKLWDARVDGEHVKWCTELLRALYPSLLTKVAAAVAGIAVPDERAAYEAKAIVEELNREADQLEKNQTAEGVPVPAKPIETAAEKEKGRMVAVLDAGLALMVRGINKGEIKPPSWSDVPALIKARRLLEEQATEILGEVGAGQNFIARDSVRVEQARATGDERAIVEAMREDLRELDAAMTALLVPIENANVLPFPQALAPAEKARA